METCAQLSDVTSIMGTSHIQMPGARPHIVTLFTVHTSLDITLLSLANQKHGFMSSDQSEACILSSLCTGLASVNIEASDPSSCLLSHDNNIYCQPQNMKIWIKQDNALPYLNGAQHNFSPSSSFAIKQISPAFLFIVNGVSQTGLSEHVNPWLSC